MSVKGTGEGKKNQRPQNSKKRVQTEEEKRGRCWEGEGEERGEENNNLKKETPPEKNDNDVKLV